MNENNNKKEMAEVKSLKEDKNSENNKDKKQLHVLVEKRCVFCAVWVLRPDLLKPCNHIVCNDCFIVYSPEHNDHDTFCECGTIIDYIELYERGQTVFYITGS